MPSLVFVAGPIAGRRYELGAGDNIIGRRSDCEVFVPDMRVSRQHARLYQQDGSWHVEDLGSNNGTFVNGHKVQTTQLHNDDELQIANNRIKVVLRDITNQPDRKIGDPHVTLVDVSISGVIRSRDESSSNIALPLAMPRTVTGQHGVFGGTGSTSTGHSNGPTTGPTTGQPASQTGQFDVRAVRLIERKLAAITDLLSATASTDDPEKLLAKVVDSLIDLFPQADSVGVLVEDEKTKELKVKCQRTRRRSFDGHLQVPGTIISHVIADKRGVLLSNQESDGEPLGTRMGAPLQYLASNYGVVYVECTGTGFRQEDVDLLGSIAGQAAMAIHGLRVAEQLASRERFERDLRVARQIQRSLLPATPPNVVGLDFAIHYEPAYQIGGDFYDFIWHDQQHVALSVGDVAGKAISAALYMARLTSELRSRAAIARTPARLFRRVNQEMLHMGDDGMFATLVYCIYNLEDRSLVFSNAGHCVPMLRRGDRVFPLHAERAHSAPIGVVPDLETGEAKVQLHTGDVLVLVSDGILEARDAKGNEYGVNRLSRRLRTARGSADDIVKAILQDIDSHTGATSQGDDMTLVCMMIDERRAKRKTTTLPQPLGQPASTQDETAP